MNRLGFIVLSILRQNGANNRLSAMAVSEIVDEEEFVYKDNTIYKKIKEFETAGLVAQGLKEGRAATFYITEKGVQILEWEKNAET